MEKSLKEHLADARRKRWERTSPEERKAHAVKMVQARWNKETAPDQ